MNKIDDKKHNELIIILSELIETIELMKEEEKDYLLIQNENEARDWMDFLKNHTDKDELKSLENEISDRFFFKSVRWLIFKLTGDSIFISTGITSGM